MFKNPGTRLHVIILPIVSILVLQASGCSRVNAVPAQPGGTYLSQSAGASFDQAVTLAGKEGEYISRFPLQEGFRSTKDSNTIYVAAGDQGVVKSTDGGATWVVIPSPLKNNRDVVVLENGTVVVSGTDNEGQGFILRSLDDGKSWQSVLTIPIPKGTKGFNLLGGSNNIPSVLMTLSLDPFNKNRLYAGSTLGTIFAGEQSAKVWRSLHTVQPAPYNPVQSQENSGIRRLVPSPHANGELLAITNDRRLLKINTREDREQEIVVPSNIGEPSPAFGASISRPREIFDVSYIPDFPLALLVGVENGAVATRDGGKTWLELKIPTDRSQKFSNIVVAVSPTNTNRMLVAINSVIYRSEDGGVTWNTFALGLPEHVITQLLIDPTNAARVLLITAPAGS